MKIRVKLIALFVALCAMVNAQRIYSGHIENKVAGEAITAPAWVYVSSADGQMYKASSSATTNPAVGLVFADVSSGDTGQILYNGVIEWDWLTPISAAKVYYLSTTAGNQTATAPTNKQHLGYTVSDNRMIINPQPFVEAGGGGASYLVYTALLNQSGTDAPVATVLENTLGETITWIYDDSGRYLATASGSIFTSGKTWPTCAGSNDGDPNNGSISVSQRISDTVVKVITTVGGSLSDYLLNDTAFEIRVYP